MEIKIKSNICKILDYSNCKTYPYNQNCTWVPNKDRNINTNGECIDDNYSKINTEQI